MKNIREERVVLTHYEAYIDYFNDAFKIDLLKAIEDFAEETSSEHYDDLFFELFLHDKLYTKQGLESLKKVLPPGAYEAELKNIRSHIYQAYHFSKEKSIFTFKSNITKKLIDTDIEKVDGYFVRLPAKSVYLSFPYNTEVKIHNPNSGTFDVKGVYIVMEDIKSNFILDKLYTEKDNARSMKILAIAGNPLKLEKQNSFFSAVVIKEGEDFFVTIRNYISQYMLAGQEQNIPYVIELFKLICNALLYINSSNPDINPVRAKYNRKAKTPKEKAQDAPFSKINYKSVGDNITIDRNYERSSGGNSSSRNDIKTLHWLVRPHWRMQAHGKGHSERKLIWIERFEKGTDLSAKITSKNYDVK